MDYAKAVLDLVKEGPKRRQWLFVQLCPKIMSDSKFQRTLNELRAEGKLFEDSKITASGRWEAWYMLPNHRYLLEVNDGRIVGAIERLKPLLLRMPTVDDIAIEIGIPPSETEPIVYKLASQTGWYNPTPEIILKTRIRLGETLVCAARIKQKLVSEDGKSEKFDYNEDAGIVEDAKRFLKNHPQLLPTLTADGEKVDAWNQEALRFLGDNYVPQDRSKPFLAVVPR